jgi:hypothetical protein
MHVPTPLSLSPGLPIPSPWNLEQFRSALQARRGRGVLLEPAAIPRGWAALRMTNDTADLIVYDHALDPQRQLHAIGHQLGHLLLGHHGHDDRQSLFAHLDPTLSATAPPVSRYAETDELDADTFAALLAAKINTTSLPTVSRADESPPYPMAAGVLCQPLTSAAVLLLSSLSAAFQRGPARDTNRQPRTTSG